MGFESYFVSSGLCFSLEGMGMMVHGSSEMLKCVLTLETADQCR